MLKRFEIENYKNFSNRLTLDFNNIGGYQYNTDCLSGNCIGKMLVYGRNGTGKTNLGIALLDISLPPLFLINNDSTDFLNADSDSNTAKYVYVFDFSGNEIQYSYEKYSYAKYKSESLLLNGKEIFNFDYEQNQYSHDRLDDISAETINVDRFLKVKNAENIADTNDNNSISFLRWIFANSVFNPDSPISEMRDFIFRMRLITISSLNRPFKKDVFFESLVGNNLARLEAFMNAMGVECKLESQKLPDGKTELYFKHKKLVPFFENASSGTMVLFNLYRRIVTLTQDVSFCYVDEFDAFFHYEMSEKFLNFFKEYFPDCQMIFTTHNTNLMSNEIMRPDCLFILSQKGELTPLNRATTREIREGHNLEKMYISGEFEQYE